MLFGAIAAIGQKNLKRLVAYSSISHMGYAIAGLATGTNQGGTANTGGGSGGMGGNANQCASSNMLPGGSGIIIIRYVAA